MKIIEKRNEIKIYDVNDINLDHTFLCGQCFRWEKESDQSFTGVAHGRVVNISYNNSVIKIENSGIDDFNNIWCNYLDLDRDYKIIKTALLRDEIMKNPIEFGYGIKILNQELFEAVISFIISANNQIPRIKKIILALCEEFGDKISFDGKTYHSFPSPKRLKDVSDYSMIKAGFRDKYIIDAVSRVISGERDLSLVSKMKLNDARSYLMKIKGVGPKVCDCALLFGAGQSETFPVDVWIARIIKELYGVSLKTPKEINDFSVKHYGKYAGFAQQYLFYYARETKMF